MSRNSVRVAFFAIGVLLLCASLAWFFFGKEGAVSAPRAVASGPTSYGTFEGVWKNEDEQTGGIARVEIRSLGPGFEVRMWGKCHPTDCDFGTPQSYDFSSVASGAMGLVWQHSFAVRNQELALFPEGRMEVVTRTRFTDGSARRDYESRDFLRKIPPARK